jgi:transcriptional regulator with XRE-family HTH domain
MPEFSHARLSAHRRRAGLTQSELAAAIGKCRSSYINYESGAAIPPPRVLGRIADVLAVPVSDLFDEQPLGQWPAIADVQRALSTLRAAADLWTADHVHA